MACQSCQVQVPSVPQQVVDGRGSAVDAPQHVPGASLQVPAQRQAVQVGEQAQLKGNTNNVQYKTYVECRFMSWKNI